MTIKKPLLGNKSVAEKLSEIQGEEKISTPEVSHERIESPKKSEVISTKEKMEAMAESGFVPRTTAVTTYLQDDPKFHLDMICSRYKRDIKDVVLRYVLEGIEKDLKTIGIFNSKK